MSPICVELTDALQRYFVKCNYISKTFTRKIPLRKAFLNIYKYYCRLLRLNNASAIMSFLSRLRHRCSPVNLLHIFRTPFPRSTFEGMLLDINGNASKKKVMERLSLLTIVISMARMAVILKLFSKFTVCLLYIFRTPFFKNTSGGLLLPVEGNGFTRQPNAENILIHTAKTTHATQFHD